MLVSPWAAGSLDAWRSGVRQSIATLLGSDRSVSLLPLPGEPPFQFDEVPALKQYADHYWRLDPISDFHTIGTQASIWPELARHCERPDRKAWQRSEFLNDWVRPQRVCQPCGLTVIRARDELPCPPMPHRSGVAGFWFFRDRPEPCASGERERAILRLLLPAFEAGLHAIVRCGRSPALLSTVLDGMNEGVVVFDERLRVNFQNRAYRQILADDREAARLQEACATAARNLSVFAQHLAQKAHPPRLSDVAKQEIQTRMGRYLVRSALLPPGQLAVGPTIVVLVTRVSAPPVALDHLQQRYRLTARETAVAWLLAGGQPNAAIARELGVSVHTARRHVEHVLSKLGIHSRAMVSAKLYGNAPSPLDS